MLNAHMDTVGVAGMAEPFSGRIADGRIYGRGAGDMKASLAASMIAAVRAANLGLRGDVVVTAVVDEELASIGTEAVLETVTADAAIVAEPTGMQVAIAHKGFVAFEIETHGRAAHGSRPDLGIDAIAKMGHVLVGVEALDRALRERPPHPLLGTGSAHAGVVAGGIEYSTYPDRCLLQAERRMLPGEPVEQAEAELQGLLDGLGRDDADFKGTWQVVGARDAHWVDRDEEIARLVMEHASAPEPVGAHFWTDAGLIGAAGIPAVLFGPGGEGAHAEDEWVSIDDTERCAAVFLAVAREFCA